jgi:hypothetical protein
VTIDLLPDVERWLAGKARQRGTTPDALVNDYLRELQRNDSDTQAPPPGSMAEFLEGYVGVFDSRTIVPGGARLSEATSEQFADLLEEKRARGRI